MLHLPSSRYCDKHIFSIILQHELLFDNKAAWNYFEAGHRKVLKMDWDVPQKEWLIMSFNNASMSFKTILISFHGLNQHKYPAKFFTNLFPPKTWRKFSLCKRIEIDETPPNLRSHESQCRSRQCWWYQLSKYVLLQLQLCVYVKLRCMEIVFLLAMFGVRIWVCFHIVIFERVHTGRFRCSYLWSWPPHL